MPRLTVIISESVFKNDYPKYENDPGAYRSPNDFCKECFQNIEVWVVADANDITQQWATEQIQGIAEKAGLLNDDHPDYSENDYSCVQCGRELTDADN